MTVTEPAPVDPNSVAALMEFLDTATAKHWGGPAGLRSWKTATASILSVEDGWESLDLRTLDQDELYRRFRLARMNDYSDDSMKVYRARLGRAVTAYLTRLDGGEWQSLMPTVKGPSKVGGAGKRSAAPAESPAVEEQEHEASVVSLQSSPVPVITPPPVEADAGGAGAVGLIRFPFPLRDNLDVWVALPRDLNMEEARRLSIFISSVAKPEHPAITDGRGEH